MAEEKDADEGMLNTHLFLSIPLTIPIKDLYLNDFGIVIQISEEEGRLKKDEDEAKEMWKRKREHEEQWEGTREQRVCFSLLMIKSPFV